MARRVEMESRPSQEKQHLVVKEPRSRIKGTLDKEKSSGKEIKFRLEISPEVIKNIFQQMEKL